MNIRVRDTLAALTFAAACFPLLAVPAGDSTGLQLVFVLVPICIYWYVAERNDLQLGAVVAPVALIMAAMCVSGLLGSDADVSSALKALVVQACVMAALFAGRPIAEWARTRSFGFAFLGVVAIHAVFAVAQLRSFGTGSLPFAGLFDNNPTFQTPFNIEADYSLYVRRLFGFSPEPSALAMILLPWTALAVARLVGTARLDRSQRLVLLAASLGSMLLVTASGSGGTLVLGVSLLPILWHATDRASRARHVASHVAIGVAAVAAAAVVLVGRSSGGNSSWSNRADSVVQAVKLWTGDFQSFVFGFGLGRSDEVLNEAVGDRYGQAATVWSATFRLITEGGVLVLVGLIALFVYQWRTTSGLGQADRRAMRAVIVASWLGFTFATSQIELVGGWLALAMAAAWRPELPIAAPTHPGRAGLPARVAVGSG